MKVIVIALILGFTLNLQAADFKAAYIDMQKAIQMTKAGKSAKKGLENEFKKKQKALEKKKKALEKIGKDLEKKKLALSEKALITKQRELQKKIYEFEQERRKSEVEIRQKEAKLTEPIVIKLQGLIEKVAKKNGYSFVFEKSGQNVMWAKKSLDITNEIVKMANK